VCVLAPGERGALVCAQFVVYVMATNYDAQ
jgi:hypothetical protein